MSTGAKLGAYALALVAVFGAGAAVGDAVGPIDVGGADHAPIEDDARERAPVHGQD